MRSNALATRAKGYLHLGRFYSILHTPKVIVKYLHGKHFHKQVFYAKLIMADLNAIFPKIGGCVFLALTLAFTFKHLSMLLYSLLLLSPFLPVHPPAISLLSSLSSRRIYGDMVVVDIANIIPIQEIEREREKERGRGE